MIKKGVKHSQSAAEFAIIFGFVLFFFVTFFTIIQGNISEKNQEKEKILLQNIALNAQEEISIASEASDGYSRTFKIPENILGKNYKINITETFLFASLDNFHLTYKIPEVIGNISKGDNLIRKQNGSVYLN
jgi:hypothetical protein